MSAVIWKFQITVGFNSVDMPEGARVLHVGLQGAYMYLWAIVDPHAEHKARKFVVSGTGWDLPTNIGPFIGTVITSDGFVWHAFEEGT